MNAGTRINFIESEPYLEFAVEVFALLADVTRVRIVIALQEGELSVNHLADIVDRSPAAVSQHLAKLRAARVVVTRKDGQRVCYRLANEHSTRLVADAIYQAQHANEESPAHHMVKPSLANVFGESSDA